MKRISCITLLVLLCLPAVARNFVKMVEFPAGATAEEKVEMASRLVPSKRQQEWQKLELTAFLHFGMNTFTNREWGNGKEDPQLFNPTNFDADQWVTTLKAAGFKMVILTAKHHDGFCLWPTATTRHSVASSPWRGGKGDVVGKLREACNRHGMKMGVYLSPWDRNAECYGDSPRYNDMLVAQLTELLTRYGRIDEVWFDGACGEGPNGRRQEYDWDRFAAVIRRLQPHAVTAIMGDDVRWVGNERGQGRLTEWSATAITPGIYSHAKEENERLGLYETAPDLGSREIVARARRLYWWPSEVDVSIRQGWFYHADQEPKPLQALADIYLNSVGRNSVLLLNVPPDTEGRIHSTDSMRLMELRRWIDASFGRNLVRKRKGNTGRLAKTAEIDAVMLGENLSKGQRIEAFTVEALTSGGKWMQVAEGTTVGRKRILTFPAVEAEAIRVTVTQHRGKKYHLSGLGAYKMQDTEQPAINAVHYKKLTKEAWTIAEAPGGDLAGARRAIDGSDTTLFTAEVAHYPTQLTIDMRAMVPVAGITYTPAADARGAIYGYELSTSLDGIVFTPCEVPGEFGNIRNNPVPQQVTLSNHIMARYVRLTALSECTGGSSIAIGEIDVLVPQHFTEPKDNERAVWGDPSAQLTLKPGDSHPTLPGWQFHTAHEFRPEDSDGHRPLGWMAQDKPHVARSGLIDLDRCCELRDGVLHLTSHELPDSADNGHGRRVKYATFALRTVPADSPEAWCTFTENMRIEVRCRRSNHVGMNDALWFMGNSGAWPANGEIDLLENPKREINQRAHFTLHSANHYAGVVGGTGSTTASIELADMTRWNIYWLEWHTDRIVGGVNGQTYFEHHRGDNGNTDWPWSNPAGFFMLITSGLSDRPEAWPGKVSASEWRNGNEPAMDIDWIRVFTLPRTYHPTTDVTFY